MTRHSPNAAVAHGWLPLTLKLLLLAAPVLYGFAAVAVWGTDTPSGDDKTMILFCDKVLAGEWRWADWFAQHNEHRLLFPKLVVLLDCALAGFNVKLLMFASCAFAAATYWLYWRWLRRAAGDRLVVALAGAGVGFCVFHAMQAENWAWGFQVCWFMLAFFSVLTFYQFQRYCETWSGVRLALTVTAGAVASFCSIHGLLALPVVLGVMLALRLFAKEPVPWRGTLTVTAAAVMVIILYFFNYAKPAHHPPLLGDDLVALSEFFLSALGSPFGLGEHWGSALLGLAVLAAGTTVLAWAVARGRLRELALPACLLVFACGFCLSITAGRGGFGLWQAFASRYTTFVLPAQIGLALLCFSGATGFSPAAARVAASLAALMLAWLGVLNFNHDEFRRRHDSAVFQSAALLDYKNLSDAAWRSVEMFHTDNRHWEILERRQWSLFRHTAPAAVRPPGETWLTSDLTCRRDGKVAVLECGATRPVLVIALGAPAALPPQVVAADLVIVFRSDTDGEVRVAFDRGAGFQEGDGAVFQCQRTGDAPARLRLPIRLNGSGALIRQVLVEPPKGAKFTIENIGLEPRLKGAR